MRAKSPGAALALAVLVSLPLVGLLVQHLGPIAKTKTSVESRSVPKAESVVTTKLMLNDKATEQDKITDVYLVVFTAVLSIATIGLSFATYGLFVSTRGLEKAALKQGKDMEESLKIGKTAADATAMAAEATKQSTDRIPKMERAYVYYDDAIIKKRTSDTDTFGGASRYELVITFINHGKTPARIVNITAFAAFSDREIVKDDAASRPVKDSDKLRSQLIAIIGSDRTWNYPAPIENSDKIENFERFRTGQNALHCWGTIQYVDIFGNLGQTNFCRKLRIGNDDRLYSDAVGESSRNSSQ